MQLLQRKGQRITRGAQRIRAEECEPLYCLNNYYWSALEQANNTRGFVTTGHVTPTYLFAVTHIKGVRYLTLNVCFLMKYEIIFESYGVKFTFLTHICALLKQSPEVDFSHNHLAVQWQRYRFTPKCLRIKTHKMGSPVFAYFLFWAAVIEVTSLNCTCCVSSRRRSNQW